MTTWHELLFRAQIEGLVSQREAMKAENKARCANGSSQAYGEDAFQVLVNNFASIENEIRNVG